MNKVCMELNVCLNVLKLVCPENLENGFQNCSPLKAFKDFDF